MVKRYRSGWWLEIKYHQEGWTQAEIAEECGVSARTIRNYMQKFNIETRDLKGSSHPLAGRERDEETRASISDTLSGRDIDEAWRERIAEGLRGRTIHSDVRERISESLSDRSKSRETRRRMSDSTAGPANPNWEGGYSRYYGPGWSLARESVRNRDGCCQSCGHDGSERRLEVHHIVPVRVFRESGEREISEAHDLSNLVLLRNSCHTKADFGDLEFESGLDYPSDVDTRTVRQVAKDSL